MVRPAALPPTRPRVPSSSASTARALKILETEIGNLLIMLSPASPIAQGQSVSRRRSSYRPSIRYIGIPERNIRHALPSNMMSKETRSGLKSGDAGRNVGGPTATKALPPIMRFPFKTNTRARPRSAPARSPESGTPDSSTSSAQPARTTARNRATTTRRMAWMPDRGDSSRGRRCG
jgi:hypothetical protein